MALRSTWICILVAGAACTVAPRTAEDPARSICATWAIPVRDTLSALVAQEDTDHDHRITVHDQVTPFRLRDTTGTFHAVEGPYALSVLLQELALARDEGREVLPFPSDRLSENPVDRTDRLIRQVDWDGLTRRIDEAGLLQTLADSKNAGSPKENFLYVPVTDARARKYFHGVALRHPELRLSIRTVPRQITSAFIQSLTGRHGILSLQLARDPATGRLQGVPYVVPGGRFNEMYGWDSYFIVRGLLSDGRVTLARAMVDNHAYQIEHYGKILNANRSYYLTRSQPPFFTAMLRDVYEALRAQGGPAAADRAWLAHGLRLAVREHDQVWTRAPRLITDPANPAHGLSRYHDDGQGPGPEVESGGYSAMIAPYARAAGLSEADYLTRYQNGEIRDARLAAAFRQDRTVRETGHDTTYRFDLRADDFVTVDLNALLYRYETDIAELIDTEFGGRLGMARGQSETPARWRRAAETRRTRMDALLWDPARGGYFDYDFVRQRRSTYVSATMFYPLWAGLASPDQARRTEMLARETLLQRGGLAASSELSRGPLHPPERPQRQWDFPYGWPPHQIIAWDGLLRYGATADAQDLIFRWLAMITRNARDFNGMITEKYDVLRASHEAFVEYGNVGAKFAYITREGFGWTNASYEVGLALLSSEQRARLRRLDNP